MREESDVPSLQRPPPSGCECASFKLGDLGTDFLNSTFHSFSANINGLPIDFHMLDSFGWDSSSAEYPVKSKALISLKNPLKWILGNFDQKEGHTWSFYKFIMPCDSLPTPTLNVRCQ